MTSKQQNVLIVGMTNCVHVARWTQWFAALNQQNMRLHAFPSSGFDIHPGMRVVEVHGAPLFLGRRVDQSVQLRRLWWWPFPRGLFSGWKLQQRWIRKLEVRRLARLIDRLQPAVIHLVETQHAGYLFLDALKLCQKPLSARVVLSIMGSDVSYFHEVPYHRRRIEQLLGLLSLVHIDCERDRLLLRRLGFAGTIELREWFYLTNERRYQAMRVEDPAQRTLVLVRGSDYWAVDGLTALAAVQHASRALGGFEIVVYSAGPRVRRRVQQLAKSGMNIRALARQTNDEMWELFGRARVLLSVSRSDGTLVAMLEAMTMGCFPIVSQHTNWQGWLEPGKTGIVLKNQELREIKSALELVLKQNGLVRSAATINRAKMFASFTESSRKNFIEALYDTNASALTKDSQNHDAQVGELGRINPA
jgi:glycosyltransferase involved in cell wall biosynthesis